MAEELKALIEKIQKEGIKAAENKANRIENEASAQAKSIVENARKEAAGIIADARDIIHKMQTSHEASLKQAARNVIIELKKEINSTLNRLIALRVREALSPKELAGILKAIIKSYAAKGKTDIIISLKKEDLDKIKEGFLNGLKQDLEKKIVLKGSEDIQGGFVISYDAGKSHFDFTDKALAEYIFSLVSPKLREFL